MTYQIEEMIFKPSYTIFGVRPGLILLHGSSMSAEGNFAHILPEFSSQRTVCTINYGRVPNELAVEGCLTLDYVVEEIVSVIRRMDLGVIDLVGESLGAVVAAAVASKRPDLIRRLILISGWASTTGCRHQVLFKAWTEAQRSTPRLANAFMVALALTPNAFETLGSAQIDQIIAAPPPEGALARIDLARRAHVEPILATIEAATLVLHGAKDAIIPPEQARIMRAEIPNSTLNWLESGHAPLFEKSREVCDLISNFLK
jgi:pimeloyl-ACP methyl ester carboxylesterase